MAVVGSQVAVTTTATLLALGSSGSGDQVYGARFTVVNRGATDCYLGGPGVTSAGFLLPAGASHATFLDLGDALYAITASGSTTVHVLASGV